MRIQSVRIQNFRCFKDATIEFDNYTCFVGANGAGKSTVFNALNVFFRQYKDSKTDLSKLTRDDFHHKNTNEPIAITVTFTDLSEQAQEDLAAYCRQGKLVVSAVATFDEANERAEVRQFGSRLGMEAFRAYFEQEKAGEKAADLKTTYAGLKAEFGLPVAGTKDAMREALQHYEAEHSGDCVLIASQDNFYGATRGTDKLNAHLQWVFVPAIKDATEESDEAKDSILGVLLSRTVRSKVNFTEKLREISGVARASYSALLAENQGVLADISTSIEERLAVWAHPDISAKIAWSEGNEKSIKIDEPFASIRIGERGFESSLARFGHGMQRSSLFALLQLLSTHDDESAPTLIMCIEEPELFQHPPQARHLAETLLELAESGNAQVFVCTHNPFFIPGDGFEHIRIARETGNPSATTITNLSYETLAKRLQDVGASPIKPAGLVAKLWSALTPITSEMYFCKVLILVEGYEDMAYIKSYLHLTAQLKEFRRFGCHVVPVMGKSEIVKPLAIAKLLRIPVFVVWDADTNQSENSKKVKHEADNSAILKLLEHSEISQWPDDTAKGRDMAMWKTNLGDEVKGDFDAAAFTKAGDQACAYFGNPPDVQKNPLKIAKHMELLWEQGLKSPTLTALVNRIVAFAKSESTHQAAVQECTVDEVTAGTRSEEAVGV